MKKTNQHILLFIFLISSFFMQGQKISITPEDVLRKQKKALMEQRNFIAESACPQREDVLKKYQANFDRLIEVLDIVTLVFHTPITIEKDRIKERGDKLVTYQSTNLTNVIVKRHSSKISMAGIVSDNSSIPVGARLLTETFTFKDKEIEVLYRIRKNKITLITLEAIYKDKTRIYVEFQNLPQAQFRVYNTSEYGTENQNLQVLFSYEIGEINLIKTTGYELYPEQYTEMITENQGLIKYRYAIRCYDEKGNQITPTQKGKEVEINPTTYLLWYAGTIGKHPIKMMLKWQFVKENNDVVVNDNRITDVLYAYDGKKKWISLHDLREPQGAILGEEKDENFSELDAANWNVPFEMNTTLKGDWNNLRGTILPITLTPMTKEFPNFIFKANIEEELTPSGTVANKIVRGLFIYKKETLIQEIKNKDGSSLDYFELGYVDINYDGYLDLFINNKFYLYNPIINKFTVNNEDDYYPYLAELGQYNLYNKSFIAQMNRSMLEYRAVDGKLNPFHSSSYYSNENGDMVMLEEKYDNGKWVTISEDIEKMEDEELVKDDDVDIGSPVNYKLVIDMSIFNKNIGFSPDFYNKTGKNLAFKRDAKLYVNLVDANGKSHQQYLYNTNINGEGKLMLDDNYILYNGKEYFLSNWDGVLPFFPTNTDSNSSYTFRLELKHPLFGSILSDKILLHLPLAIERRNIIHLKGNINNKVIGDLYAEIETKNDISATFINSKTDQRIKLKGTLKGEILNLEEYEKDDVVSGYFQGIYNNGIYKGYWISLDRETRVPFEFKKQ